MDYNGRLSNIVDKGECGDAELFDSADDLRKKVKKLAVLIQGSKKVVAFTGAGISTSCGIPDFRGPNGVWTKEQRGEATTAASNLFDTARPSFTHYALVCLVHLGIISRIVSQNVDSLHLRSGVPKAKLSELHGNIFKEKCASCGHEYLRDFDVGGMGLKPTGRLCNTGSCRGILHDEAVDWDTELDDDLFLEAENELDTADIVISMGTSLRVEPAASLPERVLEYNKERSWREGKMVIVNLQKTDRDKLADVRIFHYCDDVMRLLCRELGLTLVDTTQIQGEDVASWYTIEEGSIVAKMIQRMADEKMRAPRRQPKPRDILSIPSFIANKRKSYTELSNYESPAVIELTDSPPRKQPKKKEDTRDAVRAAEPVQKKTAEKKSAKAKKSTSTSSSASSADSGDSETSKRNTNTTKLRTEGKKTDIEQAPSVSSFRCLSFAEILERNEHKFSLTKKKKAD